MVIPEIELNTGETIPQVGLGTWQVTGETVTAAVKQAYKLGYRHVDTAEMYQNEEAIGEALKDVPREDVFITSKAWMSHYGKEELRQACRDTLRRLGVEYLDLYLLHWPKEGTDYREAFETLKELQDQGKVKSVGVSNFTVKHLEETLPIAEDVGLKISVNQVEFHPHLYQKELLEYCLRNGIVVTAYSPLAQGQLQEDETLKRAASKHGATPNQAALAWLMSHGLVVIPRSKSEEHQRENLAAAELELDPDDLEAIDGIEAEERLISPGFAEFDK
ncbi:aldo/keto reductase [Candidatus Woesearchaeota archaeon]|nr:aldo/keto reductase [Candidatus Woesearchaeota archaeon]